MVEYINKRFDIRQCRNLVYNEKICLSTIVDNLRGFISPFVLKIRLLNPQRIASKIRIGLCGFGYSPQV